MGQTKMVRQTTWDAGEIDQSLWKRTDSRYYLRGAKAMTNMEVTATGRAVKRRGSSLVIQLPTNETPVALYPFSDGEGNYYLNVATTSGSSSAMQLYQQDTSTYALNFVQSITTPYGGMGGILNYASVDGAIVFANSNFSPARIYYNTTNSTWTYQPFVAGSYSALTDPLYPQPAYDFGNLNISEASSLVGITEVSGDPSQVQFILGNVVPYAPHVPNEWVGGQIIAGGATADSPIGYGIIYNATQEGDSLVFDVNVKTPFYIPTSGVININTVSVRQPCFITANGWPSCVQFYQSRLYFGNTKTLPNTIFGSTVFAYFNFDVGIGNDTNALIYTIGQSSSDGIIAINAGKQLEIYTQHYEYVSPQTQGAGLTPTSFEILQQSSYGSSTLVNPITYLNDSFYISSQGGALINFQFQGVGLAYSSTNISFYSQHLVQNPNQRALLRSQSTSQDNFLFYGNTTLNQPRLTCVQFSNEFQNNAQGAALTPYVFATNQLELIDFCELNNVIYLLCEFTQNPSSSGSSYFIIRLDQTQRIDAAMQTTMVNGVISGLSQWYLPPPEDPYLFSVQATTGNEWYGEYNVNSSGQIVVTNAPSGTVNVTIGFIYDVELTMMNYFSGADSTYNYKQATRIFVDYQNSIDFYVNGTQVPFQDFAEIQSNSPLEPKHGTFIVGNVQGFDQFSDFSITQHSPFDLQIESVAYQVNDDII